MPFVKERYPVNWSEISKRIRSERAGNCCEWCGAENHKRHPETGSHVVLTVAHLNHEPMDCRDENLAALCQRCHLSYDAKHHTRNAKETRQRKRKIALQEAGQVALPGFEDSDHE